VRRAQGYTLVEVILVISVIAILFSVIIVNVRDELMSNQVRSATSQIVRDIERIRSAAIKRSKDSRLTLISSGRGYELRPDGTQSGASVETFTVPDGVTLSFILNNAPVTTGSINYSAPYGDSTATSNTLAVSLSGGTTQTFYLVGVTGKVIRQ
jgi:prepilin-type N-terminal cleavage/methylation domain-containing protein